MKPRHELPKVRATMLLATALLGSAARAEPLRLSAGVAQLSYTSSQRDSDPITTLELTYLRSAGGQGFWDALHLGGGVRFAFQTSHTFIPLEAFAQAELRARVGPWEPASGLEVGLGGMGKLSGRVRIPAPEWLAHEQALVGPLHFAFVAAPLRFRLGRWLLGGPELRAGPPGPQFGASWRQQIGLVRVEVTL